MKTKKPQVPLKWHGGKVYLAPQIVALMPQHLHYVEPYFGGGAVLLARDPNDESLWLPPHKGVSEVANDINGELMNFWTALQSKALFEEFQRLLIVMPLARKEFESAGEPLCPTSDYDSYGGVQVVRAVRFFVRCRQSRAGTFKGFTQLTRNRLRRGINGNVSEWLGCVENLPQIHARLQAVVVENMHAVELIHREDGPGTLYYLDPPYVHETRVSKDAYAFEMDEMGHRELLATITHPNRKSKFMLSGYDSSLYREFLGSWNRHDFDLPNNAAGGKEKRRMTECVWCNF